MQNRYFVMLFNPMLNTINSFKRPNICTILSPSDVTILAALTRYHYLSANQVLRLHYSKGSLTYVQSRLKRLSDLGYAQRLFLPRPEAHGSAPSVFRLTRKGINHLQEPGVEVVVRYRPSDHNRHSYLFLDHTLALNDFLIASELLVRASETISMAAMRHERELRQKPLYVELEAKRTAVIPDAWLDFRANGLQACLWVELDMGTEEQKRWRKKVAALTCLASGPYEKAFNTTSMTVAVVSRAGEKRTRDLIRWTEAELESLGEKAQAGLFRVGTSLGSEDPESLFLEPRWYQPFSPHASPLLEGLA